MCYNILDILVYIVEVNNIAVDINETLNQPKNVVPQVDKVDCLLFHLDKTYSLEIQRMIASKVESK